MTKILFPKTDNVTPKIIAPSDWESYFSFLQSYIEDGLVLTSKNATTLTLSTGQARVKGYVIKNTEAIDVVKTNGLYAYIQLTRHLGEASEWNVVFSDIQDLSDSMRIASVRSNSDGTGFDVDNSGRQTEALLKNSFYPVGEFGDIVLSEDRSQSGGASYESLVIDAGVTLTLGDSSILRVNGTCTINGTIDASGRSGRLSANSLVTDAGGAGGSGGNGANNGVAATVDTIAYVAPSDFGDLLNVDRAGKRGSNGGNGKAQSGTSIRGHSWYGRAGSGGSGGYGGGRIFITCDDLILNGSIISNGLNGNNGSAGSQVYGRNSYVTGGGGGGGAGGNGGYIGLIYVTKTGVGSLSILGGSAGSGGGSGENGGDGVVGLVTELQVE